MDQLITSPQHDFLVPEASHFALIFGEIGKSELSISMKRCSCVCHNPCACKCNCACGCDCTERPTGKCPW